MQKTRTLVMLAGLALMLLAAGAWGAESKCDAGITKAVGKKVSCESNVIAKAESTGLPPDVDKILKCRSQFEDACTKAKEANDCVLQSETCAEMAARAESCLTELTGVACVSNGTCAIACPNGGDDCAAAGCPHNRCVVTSEGNLCFATGVQGTCTDSRDCPPGTACNGSSCELVCTP